ncbi:MAG: hypothetical protein J6M53_08660 [Bacteroidaceae bacterium]|nr:hypothetical protein [Bacteroidaceae bacterium]
MKKNILSLFIYGIAALGLTACMDDHDEINTYDLDVFATNVGEVNTTIGAVKARYCANSNNADLTRGTANWSTKVTDDLVFEGVVVANDVSGNLYQNVMLRKIESDGTDQSIILRIKNTCLYPYFPLGQTVRVNLKGLYVGVYSLTPEVGQPYYSSYGNLNLGPMLFELLQTNVQPVGKPNTNAPELVAKVVDENWIKTSSNRNYQNSPMLVAVSGTIDEMSDANRGTALQNTEADENDEVYGKYEPLVMRGGQFFKYFAPDELHDKGYGVDRTIVMSGGTKVTLRTSTENEIAFSLMPDDSRRYTGVLTYYGSAWQLQLRDLDDIYPKLNN